MFAPSSLRNLNHPFVTWDDAFSEEELEQIKAYALKQPITDATVNDGSVEPPPDVRKSKVAWIANNNEVPWLYDRLAWVARKLNAQFFEFDLYGFMEDMQFTIYSEDTNGHYTWHIDSSTTSVAPRKLSMVLQLSDPSEYEGGELEVLNAPEPIAVDRKKGRIAAFPSWALHRVTPVTKGTRYTLVVWICGPAFK